MVGALQSGQQAPVPILEGPATREPRRVERVGQCVRGAFRRLELLDEELPPVAFGERPAAVGAGDEVAQQPVRAEPASSAKAHDENAR